MNSKLFFEKVKEMRFLQKKKILYPDERNKKKKLEKEIDDEISRVDEILKKPVEIEIPVSLF